MNKVEFLHAVEASVVELKEIFKEAEDIDKKRKIIIERAERHLKNLYKILDIVVKNLPNGILNNAESKILRDK